MKYREAGLVVGAADTLSRLPLTLGRKALFIEGFVRNTNAQLEEAAIQVAGRALTVAERDELSSRLNQTVSRIEGAQKWSWRPVAR